MPKYHHEYNAIDDPSLRDLHEGKDLADQIYGQIHGIWDACNPESWGEYSHPVSDPESSLISIMYLREMIHPLPRPEQEQIEKDLRTLAERVRRLYPDFVFDCVEKFGYARSRGRNPRMSEEDIQDVIQKAYSAAEEISSHYRSDFLVKVINQEHRLTLFAKDAMYYIFEREAEKLEDELLEAAYPSRPWDKEWRPRYAIDDGGEANAELQDRVTLFQDALRRLEQLVTELHDPLVRGIADEVLKRIKLYLQHFIDRIDESREYRPREDREILGNLDLDRAYHLLEFSSSSSRPTKEEVVKRYRDLAKKNHPDIVGDAGTARMAAINAAIAMIAKTWEKENISK